MHGPETKTRRAFVSGASGRALLLLLPHLSQSIMHDKLHSREQVLLLLLPQPLSLTVDCAGGTSQALQLHCKVR
jgi:hypothetical protein